MSSKVNFLGVQFTPAARTAMNEIGVSSAIPDHVATQLCVGDTIDLRSDDGINAVCLRVTARTFSRVPATSQQQPGEWQASVRLDHDPAAS